MDIGAIPLFSMLRSRLGYLSERQRVVAENVANANTPGYAPRDLKAFTFRVSGEAAGGPSMTTARTEAGHMAPPRSSATTKFAAKVDADSETTLDGNSVVLEDQMLKMAESRMEYDAAIGFYQKSLGLLRMAARRPGG